MGVRVIVQVRKHPYVSMQQWVWCGKHMALTQRTRGGEQFEHRSVNAASEGLMDNDLKHRRVRLHRKDLDSGAHGEEAHLVAAQVG